MSLLSHPQVTASIRALQSNVAYKLLFVNVASMVLPRIYIDFRRNRYAGQETTFYELYSVVTNYALPGLLALGTAHVLKKFKNPFNIDTTGWIGNQQIQALSDIYRRSISKDSANKTLQRFIQNSLGQLEGIDSVTSKATHLSKAQIERQAPRIQSLVQFEKSDTKSVQSIGKAISNALGTFDCIVLKEGKKRLETNPEKLIQHLSYLGRQFQKGYLLQNQAAIESNIKAIVKKLKFSNNAKTVVGLTVVSGLSFSAQFINRWFTFLKTGQKGFVGYQDFDKKIKRSENETFYNQARSPAKNGHLRFGGLESSQFLPTTDQLKYSIYPVGIVGKLLASRDWTEARETGVKAIFAYLNFLFIPNLVENMVAHQLGKKVIFSKSPDTKPPVPGHWFGNLKQWAQNVNQSQLRSYQDIQVYAKRLAQDAAHLDENQLTEKLKGVFRQPEPVLTNLKALSEPEKVKQLSKAITKELNGLKNVATLSGILYACLTLGIGLNLLNVYITNRNRHPVKPPDQIKPFSAVSQNGPLAYTAPFRFNAPERMTAPYVPNPLYTQTRI